MNLKLTLPTPVYLESLKDIAQEFKENPTPFDISHTDKLVKALNTNDFDAYFNMVERLRGPDIPKGRVPSSFLWVVAEDKIVGIADIRHTLNDYLRNVCGGHIAYALAPSYRGKGLMNQIGKLLLQYARDNFGIKEALITCHIENTPSYKVIYRLMTEMGGRPETDTIVDNHIEKRFWVKTGLD